eukprot:gnl/MRDRNA2_/MRDRNA2_36123_c0_seq2.p1 gnl/MRDRNA2_/MRDRNA2_36123_c0~~gnl/MRDRNA2_/MRDRNA2_36123_c0_seq2.p1  ORF type:complete len:290 (+),score=42.68 gnl/MRDRNA2_/MRDRNA2_36123_c0_seq2:72-872(+)
MVVPTLSVTFAFIFVLASRGDSSSCPNSQERYCNCMLTGINGYSVGNYYQCVDGTEFRAKDGMEQTVKENTVMCNVEKIGAFCAIQLHREGCSQYDDYARSYMEAACRTTVAAIDGCTADCTGEGYAAPGQAPPSFTPAPTPAPITQAPNTVTGVPSSYTDPPGIAPAPGMPGFGSSQWTNPHQMSNPQDTQSSALGPPNGNAPDSSGASAASSSWFQVPAFVSNLGIIALLGAAVAGVVMLLKHQEESADQESEEEDDETELDAH